MSKFPELLQGFHWLQRNISHLQEKNGISIWYLTQSWAPMKRPKYLSHENSRNNVSNVHIDTELKIKQSWKGGARVEEVGLSWPAFGGQSCPKTDVCPHSLTYLPCFLLWCSSPMIFLPGHQSKQQCILPWTKSVSQKNFLSFELIVSGGFWQWNKASSNTGQVTGSLAVYGLAPFWDRYRSTVTISIPFFCSL